MIRLALTVTVAFARGLFRSRLELMVENLALRQQLALFTQQRSRPRMQPADRIFWVFLRRAWRNWANALTVVEPDTVVDWQRQGFWWFWRLRSRAKRVGRARIPPEVRELIGQMARDNGWGAPRIHGELLKLGILVDERTVSRYLQHRPPTPDAVNPREGHARRSGRDRKALGRRSRDRAGAGRRLAASLRVAPSGVNGHPICRPEAGVPIEFPAGPAGNDRRR